MRNILSQIFSIKNFGGINSKPCYCRTRGLELDYQKVENNSYLSSRLNKSGLNYFISKHKRRTFNARFITSRMSQPPTAHGALTSNKFIQSTPDNQSGRYPFLDIGIVRCDWLRSKPKQSKFGREMLEMSRSETNF